MAAIKAGIWRWGRENGREGGGERRESRLFTSASFSLTCWILESLAVSVGPLDMMAG